MAEEDDNSHALIEKEVIKLLTPTIHATIEIDVSKGIWQLRQEMLEQDNSGHILGFLLAKMIIMKEWTMPPPSQTGHMDTGDDAFVVSGKVARRT